MATKHRQHSRHDLGETAAKQHRELRDLRRDFDKALAQAYFAGWEDREQVQKLEDRDAAILPTMKGMWSEWYYRFKQRQARGVV